MLTKAKIISGIQKLPDSVTIEEVLDQIILLEKIEKGIEQADNGQVLSEEDVDKKIRIWLE
jgi:predicted transcriptional regulator